MCGQIASRIFVDGGAASVRRCGGFGKGGRELRVGSRKLARVCQWVVGLQLTDIRFRMWTQVSTRIDESARPQAVRQGVGQRDNLDRVSDDPPVPSLPRCELKPRWRSNRRRKLQSLARGGVQLSVAAVPIHLAGEEIYCFASEAWERSEKERTVLRVGKVTYKSGHAFGDEGGESVAHRL